MKEFDEDVKDEEEIDTSEEDNEVDESDEEEMREAGTFHLSKPYEVDGEQISEIPYDLEAVKPIQYMNLLKRLRKKSVITVPELDENVQLGYFSLASGISVADLKRMPSVSDFSAILALVRNFLL